MHSLDKKTGRFVEGLRAGMSKRASENQDARENVVYVHAHVHTDVLPHLVFLSMPMGFRCYSRSSTRQPPARDDLHCYANYYVPLYR